ncbi:MAG: PEP-CTERM sorting domain-containing protein [Calothrix sp. MO_192.B10]|nr:PEP-CTERM sorting domain-containing protein [Calothrix sp. MO_192.B10]
MLNLTKIFGIAALSTLPIFIYSGSAHAIGLRFNLGISDNPNTNEIEAEGKMGSFSNYYNLYPDFKDKATTIDFNNIDASKKTFSFNKKGKERNKDNPFIKYTLNPKAKIRDGAGGAESNWAPSGPNGEKNKSQYLQALKDGSEIIIDFKKQMNYFGFNWGAISDNNKITFVNTKTGKSTLQQFISKENKTVVEVQDKNGNKIDSFNLKELAEGDNPQAVKASHHNEYNTFAHFFAETDDETFNQIIIQQSSDTGGGFETDNHTFHVGKTAFNLKRRVPEPSRIFGMLALGGVSIYQRRKKKPEYII